MSSEHRDLTARYLEAANRLGVGTELAPRETAELLWLQAKLGVGDVLQTEDADGSEDLEEEESSEAEERNALDVESGADAPGPRDQSADEDDLDAEAALPSDAQGEGGVSDAVRHRAWFGDGPALESPLAWSRAIHRLSQRQPNHARQILDVAASAKKTAAARSVQLVVHPAEEANTQLIVLLDRANQLFVWSRVFSALSELIEGHGSLARVDTFDLELSSPDNVGILTRRSGGQSQETTLAEQVSPGRHVVVLLVSDGLGPATVSGALGKELTRLPAGSRVAWVHPWAERHRKRTLMSTLRRGRGTPHPGPDAQARSYDVPVTDFSPEGLLALEGWVRGRRTGLRSVQVPAITRRTRTLASRTGGLKSADRVRRFASWADEKAMLTLSLASALPGRFDLHLLLRLAERFIDGTLSREHVAQALSSGVLARSETGDAERLVAEFTSHEAKQAARSYLDRSTIDDLLAFVVDEWLAGGKDGTPSFSEDLGLPMDFLVRVYRPEESEEEAPVERTEFVDELTTILRSAGRYFDRAMLSGRGGAAQAAPQSASSMPQSTTSSDSADSTLTPQDFNSRFGDRRKLSSSDRSGSVHFEAATDRATGRLVRLAIARDQAFSAAIDGASAWHRERSAASCVLKIVDEGSFDDGRRWIATEFAESLIDKTFFASVPASTTKPPLSWKETLDLCGLAYRKLEELQELGLEHGGIGGHSLFLAEGRLAFGAPYGHVEGDNDHEALAHTLAYHLLASGPSKGLGSALVSWATADLPLERVRSIIAEVVEPANPDPIFEEFEVAAAAGSLSPVHWCLPYVDACIRRAAVSEPIDAPYLGSGESSQADSRLALLTSSELAPMVSAFVMSRQREGATSGEMTLDAVLTAVSVEKNVRQAEDHERGFLDAVLLRILSVVLSGRDDGGDVLARLLRRSSLLLELNERKGSLANFASLGEHVLSAAPPSGIGVGATRLIEQLVADCAGVAEAQAFLLYALRIREAGVVNGDGPRLSWAELRSHNEHEQRALIEFGDLEKAAERDGIEKQAAVLIKQDPALCLEMLRVLDGMAEMNVGSASLFDEYSEAVDRSYRGVFASRIVAAEAIRGLRSQLKVVCLGPAGGALAAELARPSRLLSAAPAGLADVRLVNGRDVDVERLALRGQRGEVTGSGSDGAWVSPWAEAEAWTFGAEIGGGRIQGGQLRRLGVQLRSARSASSVVLVVPWIAQSLIKQIEGLAAEHGFVLRALYSHRGPPNELASALIMERGPLASGDVLLVRDGPTIDDENHEIRHDSDPATVGRFIGRVLAGDGEAPEPEGVVVEALRDWVHPGKQSMRQQGVVGESQAVLAAHVANQPPQRRRSAAFAAIYASLFTEFNHDGPPQGLSFDRPGDAAQLVYASFFDRAEAGRLAEEIQSATTHEEIAEALSIVERASDSDWSVVRALLAIAAGTAPWGPAPQDLDRCVLAELRKRRQPTKVCVVGDSQAAIAAQHLVTPHSVHSEELVLPAASDFDAHLVRLLNRFHPQGHRIAIRDESSRPLSLVIVNARGEAEKWVRTRDMAPRLSEALEPGGSLDADGFLVAMVPAATLEAPSYEEFRKAALSAEDTRLVGVIATDSMLPDAGACLLLLPQATARAISTVRLIDSSQDIDSILRATSLFAGAAVAGDDEAANDDIEMHHVELEAIAETRHVLRSSRYALPPGEPHRLDQWRDAPLVSSAHGAVVRLSLEDAVAAVATAPQIEPFLVPLLNGRHLVDPDAEPAFTIDEASAEDPELRDVISYARGRFGPKKAAFPRGLNRRIREHGRRFIAVSAIFSGDRPATRFVEPVFEPSTGVLCLLLDDDYSLGVLSSRWPWLWGERFFSSRLRADRRVKAQGVASFPWPQDPSAGAAKRVAELARRLETEQSDSLLRALDDAVLDAYGFSGSSDTEVLAELHHLNRDCRNRLAHDSANAVTMPGLPPCLEGDASYQDGPALVAPELPSKAARDKGWQLWKASSPWELWDSLRGTLPRERVLSEVSPLLMLRLSEDLAIEEALPEGAKWRDVMVRPETERRSAAQRAYELCAATADDADNILGVAGLFEGRTVEMTDKEFAVVMSALERVEVPVNQRAAYFQAFLRGDENPKKLTMEDVPASLAKLVIDVLALRPRETPLIHYFGSGQFVWAANKKARGDSPPPHSMFLRQHGVADSTPLNDAMRFCAFVSGVDLQVETPADFAGNTGVSFPVVVSTPPWSKSRWRPQKGDLPVDTSNALANAVQIAVRAVSDNGGRGALVVPDKFLFSGGAVGRVREHLLTTCNVHTVIRLPVGTFPRLSAAVNLILFSKPGAGQGGSRGTQDVWVFDARRSRAPKLGGVRAELAARILRSVGSDPVNATGSEQHEGFRRVAIEELSDRDILDSPSASNEIPVVGQTYDREQIAQAFGSSASLPLWRLGHVDTEQDDQPHTILMATLDGAPGTRTDMGTESLFLSPSEFQWVAPMSAPPGRPKEQRLVDHKSDGRVVHLFARMEQREDYVYAGRMTYRAHQPLMADRPMRIWFELEEPLAGETWERFSSSAAREELGHQYVDFLRRLDSRQRRRVHEAAKILAVPSRRLIELAKALGVDVKSPSSTIGLEAAALAVRTSVALQQGPITSVEQLGLRLGIAPHQLWEAARGRISVAEAFGEQPNRPAGVPGSRAQLAGRMRVHEAARKLGITNRELIAKLQAVGVPVKTHSSSVTGEELDRAMAHTPSADD